VISRETLAIHPPGESVRYGLMTGPWTSAWHPCAVRLMGALWLEGRGLLLPADAAYLVLNGIRGESDRLFSVLLILCLPSDERAIVGTTFMHSRDWLASPPEVTSTPQLKPRGLYHRRIRSAAAANPVFPRLAREGATRASSAVLRPAR
jgi:hypothetical protein